MNLPPLPTLPAAARPWRHRIVVTVVLVAALAVISALVDVRLDIVRVGAIVAAGATLVWYAMDHLSATRPVRWPLTDPELRTGSRGQDFRVANLTGRLRTADTSGAGRAELVRDLHLVISRIIRDRLQQRYGITPEEEPEWAESVLSPELWEFLVTIPPPDLASPVRLNQILQHVEQW